MNMLGSNVTDRVIGFRAVVTGVVEYLTGCNPALVPPPMKEDGTLPEAQWFVVQRLAIVTAAPTIILDNGKTPGFDKAPPKR
jgi:hypothetical protein